MADKKPNWIDYERKDPNYFLRDAFIESNILAGIKTVGKLMAITYLSQFENLNGEFAKRPVFIPDFRIGRIPYSSKLLDIYNNVNDRLNRDEKGFGQTLKIRTQENTKATIEWLIKDGAQLSRLYLKNKENAKKFRSKDRDLIGKVTECYMRDRDMIENLAYLTGEK